ncbi:unnamed protein product [Boreogadus saida]
MTVSILNREIEEKGIVLRELSCRTAVQLPEYTRRNYRTAAEASAAVRQGDLGASPAVKGIVLPEQSCRASAELPPPELLVHWSTKS